MGDENKIEEIQNVNVKIREFISIEQAASEL